MIRKDSDTLWSPPIWVDFNDIRPPKWSVPLDYPGTTENLARHHIELKTGLRLVLFDHDATDAGSPDDLLVLGVAAYDRQDGRWFARFDSGQMCHASELDDLDRRLWDASATDRPALDRQGWRSSTGDS